MIIQAFVDGFAFGVRIIGALTSVVAVSVLILAIERIVEKIRGSDE